MIDKKTTKMVIEGNSVIDGVTVARFFSIIDLANPKNISLSTRQIDKDACKEHRDTVRADEAEFEDYAYSMQDKILAAIETN